MISSAKFIGSLEFISLKLAQTSVMLVSMRGTNPENFSSVPRFIQILWPFEYFRVGLVFRVR